MIETFSDFASFVSAVAAVGTDRQIDDRRLLIEAVATGQHEGFGTTGGFLVPAEFADRLWEKTYEIGAILNRCSRVPVLKTGVKVPAIADGAGQDARFGGVQTFWTDEAAPAEATRPELRFLELKLKKLLALCYLTDELNEDTPALAATVERLFAQAASFALEKAIIVGSGIGAPLGVLTSPALITVAKDGGQAAGSVTGTNLSSMAARLWGPSHSSAIWLMGNDAFGKVLQLHETSGGLIETGPNGERLLLQMPVLLREYTPALGLAGDILLGDFGQYIVAEKEPQFLSSIHVRFNEDESAFKFRFRTDGQPAWAAPITPENSTSTQSPFVALGARS
jgi:HK97 family phage major capsid protein